MRLIKYLSEKTIQQVRIEIAKKGYKLGRAETDLAKKTTSYLVTFPDGKEKWLTPKEINKI